MTENGVAQQVQQARVEEGTRVLELSIVGTEFRLEEFGAMGKLPVRLEGVVFYRGGERNGRLAGKYEEDLTPILDPQHGFIGTNGRSVFTFMTRDGGDGATGEIISENQSRIVGMRDGALLVESVGTIVEGTRAFQNVVGQLISSSSIILGEDFVLNVDLKLSFTIPKPHFTT